MPLPQKKSNFLGKVRPLDITGKPLKGWVMIAAASLTDEAMASWVEIARAFAKSLPAK